MDKRILLLIPVFIMGTGLLRGNAQNDTLHIYGPGGPFGPINECAQRFSKQTGIPVKVVAGPAERWINDARQNADLIYGGAEYMLTQLALQYPGLIDATTRTELYNRAAGILVRPGNPKHIRHLKDLARPGIRILDVNGAGQFGLWEDLAGRQHLIAPIQQNIRASFANTALGIAAWQQDTAYDAWITYASWYYRLKNITALVKISPSQTLYRGTPIAITVISQHQAITRQLIRFMQSETGHAIFKKWGWE